MENKKDLSKVITGVYIFLILAIFPLFYTDYYFNILSTKYYFYCVCVFVLLLAIGIYIICQFDGDGHGLKQIKYKYSHLNTADYFMLAFILFNIIATLTSDFSFESFWGNEGRYTGCFLWLIYGISYFIITKFFKMKRWYLDAFLFSGMLACLFGITDYFQMDLLGFKVRMDPGQNNMFVSTIGNVNTYTAYVALVMGVAATLYGTAKGWKRIIWYYSCTIISFFAIIMGLSDNSYLALGALFAFLPLYLFRTRTGVKRYAYMLASFSGVIWCVDFINKIMPRKVLKMSGLLRAISGYNKLEVVVAILIAISIIIFLVDHIQKRSKDEIGAKFIILWLALICVAVIAIAFILYDANYGGNIEKYGKFSNYLIFNDDWGTHRGYNWRIAVEAYKEFSPIHKLFGYGPDTYGIITYYGKHYDEMQRLYKEVYDSVHNEYLQFFITVGPFGLISYIGLLISSIALMVKKALNNDCIMAVMFAVVCYSIQAAVNISLPISTPIMMTLLMMGLSACKSEEATEEL